MDIFPRKPILDRIIVREIPIAEYYEQPEGIDIDLDNKHIKERSDRGVVVSISKQVERDGEVTVGDTVFFDEFATSDPVYLNPAHKNRVDLPRYYQIRVADLKGVEVLPPKRPTIDELEKILASNESLRVVINHDGSISTKPNA